MKNNELKDAKRDYKDRVFKFIFGQKETKLLDELANVPPCVISCGGGRLPTRS